MNATDSTAYPTPFDKPIFNLPSADFSSILTIVFFLIFVAWTIYTVVVAYHWFRYGHRSWLAIPAIVVHLIISGILILMIASGV